MKFHLTHRGEAKRCGASRAACPYGDESDHFATAQDARQAFEQSQQAFTSEAITERLNRKEAKRLYATLAGESSRVQFMRCALEAYELFGSAAAEVFATVDSNGSVLAAACLIRREEDDLPPYYVLDYLGARGGGAGSQMVRTLQAHARAQCLPIFLEATADSEEFWTTKMSAVQDHEHGTDYYVLPL